MQIFTCEMTVGGLLEKGSQSLVQLGFEMTDRTEHDVSSSSCAEIYIHC